MNTLHKFLDERKARPAEERERIHKKDAKKHLLPSLPFYVLFFPLTSPFIWPLTLKVFTNSKENELHKTLVISAASLPIEAINDMNPNRLGTKQEKRHVINVVRCFLNPVLPSLSLENNSFLIVAATSCSRHFSFFLGRRDFGSLTSNFPSL